MSMQATVATPVTPTMLSAQQPAPNAPPAQPPATPPPKLLRPESVVNLVWSIAGEYSKATEEQNDAQLAEAYLDNTVKEIQPAYPVYADEVTSFAYGAKRTFSLIVRHRNYEFDEIEGLKQNKIQSYQQLQTFSGSLQGVFPRLAGIAVGGTSLPLLISQVFPTISQSAITLMLVLFGGVGYVVAELASQSIGANKLNQTTEYFEKEKDTQYDEFIAKSKLALQMLLANLVTSYHDNVDSSYTMPPKQQEELVGQLVLPTVPTR